MFAKLKTKILKKGTPRARACPGKRHAEDTRVPWKKTRKRHARALEEARRGHARALTKGHAEGTPGAR